jgi:hypothetical protein
MVCKKRGKERWLGREEYSEVRMTVNLIEMHESRIRDKNERRTYVFSTHLTLCFSCFWRTSTQPVTIPKGMTSASSPSGMAEAGAKMLQNVGPGMSGIDWYTIPSVRNTNDLETRFV